MRTIFRERGNIDRMISMGILDSILRDFLYALRGIRRNPAFAAMSVLTLALGIGANTAIFSVVRAVLLKPLEYHDPDRLVAISGGATATRAEEIQKASRSFTDVGIFLSVIENITLSGAAGPEVLKEARVSANFLNVLGVEPVLGRSFRPEEEKPNGPPVALISEALWRRRFDGDHSILGKTATLAATPYSIIGVLPLKFQFPFAGIDVWLTKPSEYVRPLSPILAVFARLKPQVSIQQASAELVVINRQYARAHPGMLDAKPKTPSRVTPLNEGLVSRVRGMLWMLFGAVGFVLLIACANVASLLLARAVSRSQEFAVRAALGAARRHIIGQLLAESVLLSLVGGASGLLLAKWSLSAIPHLTALNLPRTGEIRLDGAVLAFAILLSILTGLFFGLVPSLAASRPDLAGILRASGETASSKPVAHRFGVRDALVVGQVALSLVLLIGATLLIESLAHLHNLNLGFRPSNLLTMRVSLSPSRYDTDQKKARFYRELVRRVESLPGVASASVTLTLPLTGYAGTPVQNADRPPLLLNQRPLATIQIISPDYFRTLEVPFQRGRPFSVRDDLTAPLVVIVDESLARLLWPSYPAGRDPVGQHLLIGSGAAPAAIVGVVSDVHQTFQADSWPGIYRPSTQVPLSFSMFAVRTNGDPLRLANPVRREVLAIDRDQAVSEVKTMEDIVEDELGQRRVIVSLLGFFAGLALVLAAVGLYGVIAYSVVQRTKELGIRQALGARSGDILSLVLGHGLALTSVGIFLGIAGAFGLTRVMRGLLFQVGTTDPATFAAVSLVFFLLTLAATYLPARRALTIDPIDALRMG